MPVIDDCLSFQGLALQLSSLKPLLIFYIHMDLYTCTWSRLRWIKKKSLKVLYTIDAFTSMTKNQLVLNSK